MVSDVFDTDFTGRPTTTESAGALVSYLGFQVCNSDVTTNDAIPVFATTHPWHARSAGRIP